MDTRIEQAVLRAICYSDVFDYPLKYEEIWYWLADEKGNKFSKEEVFEWIDGSRLVIRDKIDGYVCLRSRKQIINLRTSRFDVSKNKVKIARIAASWLSRIPTVEAVLITGSLAMNNARANDDIDLMVLTTPGCLWVTRFWCVVMMELAGMRRRPESSLTHRRINIANKICLNLFLDMENLQMPSGKRDLYFAHEILQARPIFSRGNGYGQFIEVNSWIAGILPNACNQIKKDIAKSAQPSTTSYDTWLKKSVVWSMKLFEFPLFWIQGRYMRRRQSKEIVTARSAMFHPFDYREWVMKEYRKRLRKLGIRQ